MRVLFATAELSPVARVGGLAAAAAGLVKALRRFGLEVDLVLPDYAGTALDGEIVEVLDVPEWAGPAVARTGDLAGVGRITLIDAHGIRRSHPYLQPDGAGWPDNDVRFFAFSAALASYARRHRPDVLHLNDWHTCTTLAFLWPRPATVLTIHTLGYQGWSNPGWIEAFPYERESFALLDGCNPLAGGIRLADAVISVSPTYARESLTVEGGAGLEALLAAKGDRYLGILNGIDTDEWDPAADRSLAAPLRPRDPTSKRAARTALRAELGLADSDDALAVMVTRLVAQKGVDLVLPVAPYLGGIPMQLAVLGSGEQPLVEAVRAVAVAAPDRVVFREGYDEGLAHRLFAGADLFVMPSRFEPCGLAQMQAMRYGTVPVVTDVGGLHDTVVDADEFPATGTGIVARGVDPLAVLDALHRGARLAGDPTRLAGVRGRQTAIDWSWDGPARRQVACYADLLAT